MIDRSVGSAEALVSTEVTEDGDNYSFNRTYGNGQSSVMKFTIGAESDFKVQLAQSRPLLPVMAVPSRPLSLVLMPVWKLSVANWLNHGPLVVLPSSVCPANK